ncbi:MAG: YihA family ribosome biogenesis GTP-binding protein [Bacteroidales bacterium]|nr:YihA family ribosome biogenesis GTP-binding protein [Bacteroidales bacterium]
MNLLRVKFISSSPGIASCPADGMPEFAFIGRSNVGKSSLINMLTSRRGVAKVSSTPGKTRLINHFLVNDSWYLVDLPGYGFAKISQSERKKIREMIDTYILNREEMRCLFVLIDSRLVPQKNDLDFLARLGEKGIPFFILFTKIDKLSAVELQKSLARYKKRLSHTWEELPLIVPTSAKTKEGREIILGIIEEVLEGRL